jgi:hypothetical protein
VDTYPIQSKTYVNTDLLIEQFKDSEKFKALIDSDNARAQDIETAVFEIRTEFEIDDAVGAQLDILGQVWNEERLGMDDDTYRAAIKAKSSNQFSGEPENIFAVLISIFGATYINYRPFYPAKYYINTDVDISSENLVQFSPSGVLPLVEGYDVADGNGNRLADGNGNILTATK